MESECRSDQVAPSSLAGVTFVAAVAQRALLLEALELEDLEEALEPVSAHGGAGAGVSPARQL